MAVLHCLVSQLQQLKDTHSLVEMESWLEWVRLVLMVNMEQHRLLVEQGYHSHQPLEQVSSCHCYHYQLAPRLCFSCEKPVCLSLKQSLKHTVTTTLKVGSKAPLSLLKLSRYCEQKKEDISPLSSTAAATEVSVSMQCLTQSLQITCLQTQIFCISLAASCCQTRIC